MSEHNGTKNVLIGVMTIAMIVIGVFVVDLINNHKVILGIVAVSHVQEIPSVSPTEVRRVIGIVEKVSGQEITLKDFRKISSIVSAVSDQSTRMVVGVDQTTLIERLMHKSTAAFSAELDSFYKNIQKIQAQNPSTPPVPPIPFTLEKVALSDIKVGDRVTASFAEDIAKLTTFTAAKIEIQN